MEELMATRRPFFLNGRWKETDQTVSIVNPYTSEVLAEVCLASEQEVEEALEGAVRAFEETRRQPTFQRASILQRIAQGIASRREELARIITEESGKPLRLARGEVDRAVETFTLGVEEARRLTGEYLPLDLVTAGQDRLAVVRRFPIGPVLGITPFNFPLNLIAHKLAPALAVGNPIIIKPAPQAPLTALKLAEIIEESGAVEGSVSVLPCRNEVAERMVRDERIKLLSFTGSAAVGWYLKSIAGKKRVLLELGGNAGAIVHEDANLDYAADRLALGSFAYAGQICISVQRIFVHRPIFKKFLDKFLQATRAIKVGDPKDPETLVGPMIDEAAAQRAESWLKEALSQGVTLLLGGKRSGKMFEPTVITGTTPEMKICAEEVFAPIVAVEAYESLEQALHLVEASRYGLQAGIFTRDLGRVLQAFEALTVGGVMVNDYPTFRVDHMPYGGVKDSGLGREGVRYAIEEMTERKILVINLQGL